MPTIDWELFARLIVPALVAILLDVVLGDPPGFWHPVAWMGAFLQGCRKLASPLQGRTAPLLAGGLIILVGVTGCLAAGWLVSVGCQHVPPLAGWLIEGVLLKMTLASRGLALAARQVQAALEEGDLKEARRLLSWHLVSRDTTTLTESQVRAATIESVAENTSDGVVAPLFWYAVGGLPAALAYRLVNTADAILGYRDAEREWLGKLSARCDDLVNIIPARLTAGLMLLLGGGGSVSVRIWWSDCRKTASPNAGHPMAAAAGILGVELEKVGLYTLGEGQRQPEARDLRRTIGLLWRTTAGTIGLLFCWALVRGVMP